MNKMSLSIVVIYGSAPSYISRPRTRSGQIILVSQDDQRSNADTMQGPSLFRGLHARRKPHSTLGVLPKDSVTGLHKKIPIPYAALKDMKTTHLTVPWYTCGKQMSTLRREA